MNLDYKSRAAGEREEKTRNEENSVEKKHNWAPKDALIDSSPLYRPKLISGRVPSDEDWKKELMKIFGVT